LLQKLTQPASEVEPTWFQKLFVRRPLWQTVSAVLVVLVFSGIILSVVLRNEPSAPVIQAPDKTFPAITTQAPALTSTTPAKSTTAPATTVAAATTATSAAATTSAAAAPTGIQNVKIMAEASTDKNSYAPGEKVVIEVKLKNAGSGPLVLAQFPPILSLMSSAGNPVISFLGNQGARTLAAGETASFYQIWDLTDAKGRSVPAGIYHLELEDLDMQGQAYKLHLSQPVSFEIKP
jgi:hypothetical protein